MMMATCWLLNEVGVNMLPPYKAHFQPKFRVRYSTEVGTMYGSLTLLPAASRRSQAPGYNLIMKNVFLPAVPFENVQCVNVGSLTL